ncbi:MAG: radical protein [Anaerocolumna sp.]|jgi:radical SAM protein with 4Fe4S-binding SPASM domain|nr:radical protein [Anaerocolumna sp.]
MYLKKQVIWKDSAKGSMLYDTRSERKLVLNDTGTQVFLSKFVKYATDEEIASSLHAKFNGEKYEDLLSDVKSVLNDIYSSDFVTDDCEQRGYVNLLEIDPQIDSVIFEVTSKCNLNCIHCLEGGSREINDLTTKEIFDLIDELHWMKVYRIVLTGGEPFVREDIVDIIKKCTEKNIRVTVFTNGTLITEKLLDQIKDTNVLLRFSIDGADALTHDEIRGEGNFDKTIGVMKLCKEKGIDIGVATTITTHNFDQYHKIVDLVTKLDAKEIELSEIQEKGNATTNKHLLLSQKQMEQLRVNSLVVAAQNERLSKGMGFDRLAELAETDGKGEHCCNAGVSVCYINAEGSAYPCMLFKDFDEFKAGNIREQSFTDIWTSSQVLERMRELKVTDIESCVKCECFEACPGGCRAIAYAQSNRLDGPMDNNFCCTSINLVRRRDEGEFDYILKRNIS